MSARAIIQDPTIEGAAIQDTTIQDVAATKSRAPGDRTLEEITSTAVVKILNGTRGTGLYCDAVRPDGTARFGTSAAAGTLTVSFQGETPLQGVKKTFQVFPGPEVEFRFKSGADGSYAFDLETTNGVPFRGLVLDVSAAGTVATVGFSVPEADLLSLQMFTKSSDGAFTLLAENQTGDQQKLELSGPGVAPTELPVDAGRAKSMEFDGSGFGERLRIRLIPRFKIDQSGGTEQAEVIVEPDS